MSKLKIWRIILSVRHERIKPSSQIPAPFAKGEKTKNKQPCLITWLDANVRKECCCRPLSHSRFLSCLFKLLCQFLFLNFGERSANMLLVTHFSFVIFLTAQDTFIFNHILFFFLCNITKS